MTAYDSIGLTGTALMLGVYALTIAGRMDARGAAALGANFLGAGCVLVSLSHDFNLSAAVIEGAWALIALGGLVRLAVVRR